MIIEQPDAFKTWLTAVLKPMCEADPAALAKYVLALIKKDKSGEELQKIMIEQLEVFLQNETESFVNLVLNTLETQDYITTPVIPNTNPPNPATTTALIKTNITGGAAVAAATTNNQTTTNTTTKDNFKETNKTIIVHPNDLPNLNIDTATTLNGSSRNKESRDDKISTKRARHRSPSRNRTRSRSRSWDRSKRSKSRENKRERTRSWRNKSPPRRYERSSRRSRTPSINRMRSRSRSPPRSGGTSGHQYRSSRYRNRTPPLKQLSRSRSRSAGDKRLNNSGGGTSGANKENKELSRTGTPTQDSNHGDMDLRLTNSTQSIQSVIIQQNSKRRCRDFDEKGYCMRGEMCPFDHGVDPVVLEDAALSSVLTYNPNGTNTVLPNTNNGDLIAPGSGSTGNLVPPPAQQPIVPLIGGSGQRLLNEYNPQAPQIWNRSGGGPGGYRGGIGPRPPMLLAGRNLGGGNFIQQPQQQQRELVPVPVVMDNNHHHNQKNDYQVNYHHNHHNQRHHPNHHQQQQNYNPMIDNDFINNNNKKKPFDFNRLGPRSNGNNITNNNNTSKNNNNTLNCSLELKKVPQGLNSIQHLNNHFSKFGKTVNIQVNYDGDPEAAIVTFSSHAEANAAYRSTEAVLNNRFIKVFWHNPNTGGDKPEQQQLQHQSRSIKERLGVVPPNTNKVFNLIQSRVVTTTNNNATGTAPSATSSGGDNCGGGLTGTTTTNTNTMSLINTTTTTTSTNSNGTTTTTNSINNNISNDNEKLINDSNNKLSLSQNKLLGIKKSQELLLKLKKNQDEQRKEVLKLKCDLIKRKQDLLDKQLAQQKVLLEKVDKMSAGAQRDAILETIKKSQESIETIKKDLLEATQKHANKLTNTNNMNNNVTTINNTTILPPPKKLKEDVQREMLDAELDLITKQQEGADTSELQKKLFELKAKAAMAKQLTNNGGHKVLRGGGLGGSRRFNLISRHLLSKNNLIDGGLKGNIKSVNKNSFQKHAIDHRPTRLLVSGYETEEQDSVLKHFQQYGEVVDYEIDSTLPSITLNYKTRKEAEMALLKGKHFQDRTLSITWSNNLPTNQVITTQPRTTITTPPATTTSATPPVTATVVPTEEEEDDDDEAETETKTQGHKSLNLESDEDRLIEQNLNDGTIDEDLGPVLSEEILLQDDEEEEDEGEDRSWRR